MPVVIGGDIRNKYGIEHAMEVLVSGNSVRKFKKYNSNFAEDRNFGENIYIDFLTAVNYSMVLKGGDTTRLTTLYLVII